MISLIEASSGADQFGVDRVKAGLRAAPPDAAPRQVLDALTAAFDKFLGGAQPGDDVTAVCLRVR